METFACYIKVMNITVVYVVNTIVALSGIECFHCKPHVEKQSDKHVWGKLTQLLMGLSAKRHNVAKCFCLGQGSFSLEIIRYVK